MGPPTNRDLLTSGAQVYARKKHAKRQPVEEITFDRTARKDFLTGFHKRKVARKTQAQEKAMLREKEAKKEEKRLMKEEQLRAAKKDLERYNKQIADLVARENSEDEVAEGNESDSDFSDWEGMDKGEGSSNPTNGILKKRNEYDDEDGETTTVVIESMDTNGSVSDHDRNVSDDDEDEKSKVLEKNAVDLSMSDKVLKSSLEKAELSAKHLAMINSKRSVKRQQLKLKKQKTRVKGVAKQQKKQQRNKKHQARRS